MKCPQCKEQMRCLDTRWQEAQGTKLRRWQCVCGVKGKTQETWVQLPSTPKPKPPKKVSKLPKMDALTSAFYGKTPTTKKEKHVDVKHKPSRSLFEDTDEDSSRQDFSDLGLDIPRGDDW